MSAIQFKWQQLPQKIIDDGSAFTRLMTVEERAAFTDMESQWITAASACAERSQKDQWQQEVDAFKNHFPIGSRLVLYMTAPRIPQANQTNIEFLPLMLICDAFGGDGSRYDAYQTTFRPQHDAIIDRIRLDKLHQVTQPFAQPGETGQSLADNPGQAQAVVSAAPQKSSTAFIFLLLLAAVFLLSKDKKLKL